MAAFKPSALTAGLGQVRRRGQAQFRGRPAGAETQFEVPLGSRFTVFRLMTSPLHTSNITSRPLLARGQVRDN